MVRAKYCKRLPAVLHRTNSYSQKANHTKVVKDDGTVITEKEISLPLIRRKSSPILNGLLYTPLPFHPKNKLYGLSLNANSRLLGKFNNPLKSMISTTVFDPSKKLVDLAKRPVKKYYYLPSPVWTVNRQNATAVRRLASPISIIESSTESKGSIVVYTDGETCCIGFKRSKVYHKLHGAALYWKSNAKTKSRWWRSCWTLED